MAQRQVELGLHLAAAGQIRYAIAVLDRQYGPDHPLIIQAMIRKAGILSDGEQLVAAEAEYLEAIDRLHRRLPPSHPHIADALTGYSKLLMKTPRTDEAEKLARECLSIRETSLPTGDWRRASAKCLVGEALFAQKKFELAEPLLLEGLDELSSNDEAPDARLDVVRNCLVALYEALEKPDKADAYRPKRRATTTTAAPRVERRPGKAIE
jgi:tetratricopeptide (TPR) repeat protein